MTMPQAGADQLDGASAGRRLRVRGSHRREAA